MQLGKILAIGHYSLDFIINRNHMLFFHPLLLLLCRGYRSSCPLEVFKASLANFPNKTMPCTSCRILLYFQRRCGHTHDISFVLLSIPWNSCSDRHARTQVRLKDLFLGRGSSVFKDSDFISILLSKIVPYFSGLFCQTFQTVNPDLSCYLVR